MKWNEQTLFKLAYSSVVSSGNTDGTLDKLFSRQSTIPSAQRHGWGHKLLPPHSIGACSVNPVEYKKKKSNQLNSWFQFDQLK